MVYAILIHSVVSNPHLHSLGALLQHFQTMPATANPPSSAPNTPSSSANAFTTKFPFTPSKNDSIGLQSPAAAMISASASNALPIPGAQLYAAQPATDNPTLIFNGIPLTPSQTGSAGGPPENVTMFSSQFFDNFDGLTSAAEQLGQAIATQTAVHFYQYKQLQVGAYSTAVQDEIRRRKNPNSVVPPSPAAHLDSVWASPALAMAGDGSPSIDGIYSLPPNQITKQPLRVVWKHHESCLFSLVCYEDENHLIGLNFLQLLPRLIVDQYRQQQICQTPRELLARPEEILAVLNTYLPNGLLQAMPNALARQLKRDSDQLA